MILDWILENKTKKDINGTIEGICIIIVWDNGSNAKYPLMIIVL